MTHAARIFADRHSTAITVPDDLPFGRPWNFGGDYFKSSAIVAICSRSASRSAALHVTGLTTAGLIPFSGDRIEVLPGGVAYEDFALLNVKGSYQGVEPGVWSAVQTDEHRSETAGSAVGGEVEFFLPAALSRSGNRDANLKLAGAVVEQAIDLPTFVPITLAIHRTLPGRSGSTTDGVRNDRLEQVSRFLSGSVVDVPTAFIGQANRLCSVSERAGSLPDRCLGFCQSHSCSTLCPGPFENRCLTR